MRRASHRARAGCPAARSPRRLGSSSAPAAAGLLPGQRSGRGRWIGRGRGSSPPSRSRRRARARRAQTERVQAPQAEPQTRLGGHLVEALGATACAQSGSHPQHRQRPSRAEREADDHPDQRIAAREADARERPHRERKHERREAEPEQHAVESARERQRHRPAPALGHLPANLRRDLHAAPVCDRRRQRDRSAEPLAQPPDAPADERARERQRRRT